MTAQKDNIIFGILLASTAVGIVAGMPGTIAAKTWYVAHDGTGDAPSIAAAVDSSASGDTVLVGPGTYEIGSSILVEKDLVITSENGPYETRLVPRPLYYPHYAFILRFISTRAELSGFWIEGFRFGGPDSGAISVLSCWYLYLQNNVLVNNLEASIAVDITTYSAIVIQYNTIIGSESGYTISGNSSGDVRNNILWGVGYLIEGAWLVMCNCMMDVSEVGVMADLNFQADPQFCGSPTSGNLFLQEDSPCAPGNTPPPLSDCGLVGALPVGCGTTPVKRTTWGQIKSLYK